jgi:glutamine synthetase adenylyltransferase
MLRLDDLSSEMRAFLRSSMFLRRFLVTDQRSAKLLAQQIGRVGAIDASLVDAIEQVAMTHQESRTEKAFRHLRAMRVMGPGHAKHLLRYFQDRRRLRQKLLNKTLANCGTTKV